MVMIFHKKCRPVTGKKSEIFWDKQADNFDKRASYTEQTHLKTVEYTKKYLNCSDIVLDYGCATGTVAIKIADKVKKIHGIDISSRMIDAAKRKSAEHKIENIDFAQSTIFNEKFRKESFDLILALNILLHVEETQKVMQRINELLKPGGLFISATACLGEKQTFSGILAFILLKIAVFFMKIGGIPGVRFFTISELEDSITDQNFQIVETVSLAQITTNRFIVAKKREGR